MAYTNHTTNYELPQYIGTDKPTYLGDFNGAMSTIDGQMKTNANNIVLNSSKIGVLENLTTTEKTNLVGAINEVKSSSNVGDLSDLTTTDKTSAVSAINEVDGNCDTNTLAIGTLSNLTTTEKTNLVGAINEIDGECGNLSNLTTTEKSNLVGAINEIKSIEDTLNGVVDKLKIHGKYLERNSMSGTAQSVTANTLTYVSNYSNEYVNQFTNNEITYNAGEFTINTDDITHVFVNVQVMLTSPATIYMYLVKNTGTEIQYAGQANENRHEISYFMQVAKNDVIKVGVYLSANDSIVADKNNLIQIVAF